MADMKKVYDDLIIINLYHIIRIFKEHFEIKEFLEQMFYYVLYVKLYVLVENGY